MKGLKVLGTRLQGQVIWWKGPGLKNQRGLRLVCFNKRKNKWVFVFSMDFLGVFPVPIEGKGGFLNHKQGFLCFKGIFEGF